MKRFALWAGLGLALFMGLIFFRDSLLSTLAPPVASHFGVDLRVEGLHLELHPLVLGFKRIQAGWEGGEASLERGRVRLSLFPFSLREVVVERGRVRALLSREGRGIPVPSRLERLELESLALSLKAPWGEVEMQDARILLGPHEYYVRGLLDGSFHGARLEGRFSLAGSRASLAESHPRGGGWLEGTLAVGGRTLHGTLLVPRLWLEPRGPLLKAEDVRLFLPKLLELKGDFTVHGDRWRLDAQGKIISLTPWKALFPKVPIGMDGTLEFSGWAAWDGGLSYDVDVKRGRVTLRGLGRLERAGLSFKGALRGEGGKGAFSLASLNLLDLKLPWGEERNWRGRGYLGWRDWGRGGIGASLSLAQADKSLVLRFSSPGPRLDGASLLLSLHRIPVAWLARWFPRGILPGHGAGLGLKGSLAGEAKARFEAGKWRVHGAWRGEGLSFSTPRGNGAEALKVKVSLISPDLLEGPWTLSVDLLGGQFLYSYWLFDFGQRPWHLSLEGRGRRGIVCLSRVTYEGLARARFEGKFCIPGGGGGDVALWGESGDLYKKLLVEPLGEDVPLLRVISPSGEMGARLSFSWIKGLEARGVLRWKGKVEARGASFEGEFSLPVVYAPQGREEGELRVDAFVLGPVTLRGWETPLEARPFVMRALRGHHFSLWRGKVKWGPFSIDYREPLHPRLEVDGLEFRDVVPPKVSLPMVLNGVFKRVDGKGEGIFFQGEVKIKVAKGEVKISHIRLINPFSPLMRLGCDVEFHHLDLADLTRVTPFGRITGYIRGYVKDLVISHGQPQSFRMRVETQDVKGVKKRISLEAINSISILGGGGPVSLFLPFFKSFGYRYLGFSCTLKNDVFTLHGLRRRGKVEYIVVRGGLTGVDVINRNPNSEISFADMLERLERIRRGSHEKG